MADTSRRQRRSFALLLKLALPGEVRAGMAGVLAGIAGASAADAQELSSPSGSVTRLEHPGAGQSYRPQLIGGSVLVLVLQTGLIVGLLVQRRRRVRIERALSDSQERYRLAAAAGKAGVWDWNFATNALFVDASLKSILGFDDAEISSRPEDWGARVHPQDVPAASARIQACLDHETDTYDIEHRMLHKDGSVRWFLSRGSAIRGADGTLLRLVGTKVDITERRRAEDLTRETEIVLQASDQENQLLVERLITARETERARIARDLHDDTSQQLAALAIALSAVRRRIEALHADGTLLNDVAVLQRRTIALSDSVRDLSHGLHPSAVDQAGLVATLAACCADVQRQHGLAVSFSADSDIQFADPEIALCLFRIAQEALQNVVVHAAARNAVVRLQRTGDSAELTIADDGKGFDITGVGKGERGLGLVSINERVRLMRGTVSIATGMDQGTRVCVRLPAPRQAPLPGVSESGPYAASF